MAINRDPKTVADILTRGVDEVIVSDNLKKKLLSGEPLRVKFGVDPTAPDLHLGHTVPLRKLRQFQDAGHKAVLIIGDFTATIGDPSGRTETRKPLSPKEVKNNLKKYLRQAGKILNLKKTEIYYNSRWFKKGLDVILSLLRSGSLQQVLHRADFKKRLDDNQDITLIEVLYPLFQGYDSVMVRADVEIGGTDQKFNLLMGRQVQRYFNQGEQDILTVPILEGLDGVKKMSKSYGNYVALDDKPEVMFGKIMSLPDSLIDRYFRLCTGLTEMEIPKSENPRDAKLKLAYEMVNIYHGKEKAQEAQDYFVKTFQKKEIPEDMPEIKVKSGEELADILIKENILKSKSEFKRLVDEKGVHDLINKKEVEDYRFKIEKEIILKIGKKRFLKISVV